MCSSNDKSMFPYPAMNMSAQSPYLNLQSTSSGLSTLNFYKSQLFDYRHLLGLRQYHSLNASGMLPYYTASYWDQYSPFLYKCDARSRFVQEEPKPSQSYIGLIAMAILGARDKKLVLSDIYQWILDKYPYFRSRGSGWRNSIRHNLSLNDCFVKSGRSANGKGHYWAVHPANVDDFSRGDFRRRRAQRKVRKHMGLSAPDDDEDSPAPSPTPISWAHIKDSSNVSGGVANSCVDEEETKHSLADNQERLVDESDIILDQDQRCGKVRRLFFSPGVQNSVQNNVVPHESRKRLFDVESLLAPDNFPMLQNNGRLPKEDSTITKLDRKICKNYNTKGYSDLRNTSDSESDVDIEGEFNRSIETCEDSCTKYALDDTVPDTMCNYEHGQSVRYSLSATCCRRHENGSDVASEGRLCNNYSQVTNTFMKSLDVPEHSSALEKKQTHTPSRSDLQDSCPRF